MLIDAGGGTVDTITYTVFNDLTARRLLKWAAFVGRHRAFATPSSRKVTKREHTVSCSVSHIVTLPSIVLYPQASTSSYKSPFTAPPPLSISTTSLSISDCFSGHFRVLIVASPLPSNNQSRKNRNDRRF